MKEGAVKNLDTKQKVLDTALDLFSRRGYFAVSVRDISYAVGVKESALYKHFKNKRDVFDTLVQIYEEKCNLFMKHMNVLCISNSSVLAQTADFYTNMSDEKFLEMTMIFFNGYLMAPDVKKFYRMLSIEQFGSPEIAELYKRMLFDSPIGYQTKMFELLIRQGHLKPAEPKLLALEFFLPALSLYLRLLPFDENHEMEQQSLQLFERHILHFRKIYANHNGE